MGTIEMSSNTLAKPGRNEDVFMDALRRMPDMTVSLRYFDELYYLNNKETIGVAGGKLQKGSGGGRMTWSSKKDELVQAVENLGFPPELGEAVARHLGSPKAMERMISYLCYVKPKSEELIVDEMLAIRSEIDAWREKKASEEANASYLEQRATGYR